MGIFSRFSDIISSNINAMLDKAEDPERLIKLMIREMEDTMVEIKVSCAGTMANRKRVERQIESAREREAHWEERAAFALTKGREDLAREALQEKRRFTRTAESLEEELVELAGIVEQYQDDIRQLEDKLRTSREKQRILVERHIRARGKHRAQAEIRRADSYEAVIKFDEMESRIERMEAEADLVNYGRSSGLAEELERLAVDEEIEKELADLKSSLSDKGGPNPAP